MAHGRPDARRRRPPTAHLFQADGETIRPPLESARLRGDPPPGVDGQLVRDIFVGTLLYRVLSRRSTDDVVEVLLVPSTPEPAS